MSIHERIREIRQALGLSQAKFAKDISISSGYVAGLEPKYLNHIFVPVASGS